MGFHRIVEEATKVLRCSRRFAEVRCGSLRFVKVPYFIECSRNFAEVLKVSLRVSQASQGRCGSLRFMFSDVL